MKVAITKKADADKGKGWAKMNDKDKLDLLATRLGILDADGNIKHVDDWLDDLYRRLQND